MLNRRLYGAENGEELKDTIERQIPDSPDKTLLLGLINRPVFNESIVYSENEVCRINCLLQ